MLRKCAEAGTGEAAWLLARLLEETGDTAEAMIWYQHASDDGDDRADAKLAALRIFQSCPHPHRGGSPREHHPAAPDQTEPALYLSHASEAATWSWARHGLLPDAVGHADQKQVADVPGSGQGLPNWLMPKDARHGTAPGECLLKTSVVPVVLSCAESDHLASIEDVYRAVSEARNCVAHDTSWVRASLVMKLIKMLRAGGASMAGEWALPTCWCSVTLPAALARAGQLRNRHDAG